MEEREVRRLVIKLEELGFPDLLATQMEPYAQFRDMILPIKYREGHGEDVVNFTIYVGYNQQAEEYEILQYRASLRRRADLSIPALTINGVNAQELDRRMSQVDWWIDRQDQRMLKMELNEGVWQLSENDHPVGLEAQEKLILKYLADTPYGEDIANLEKIRARHEIQRSFDSYGPLQFTVLQVYNLMSGRAIAVEIEQDGDKLVKWVQATDLAKDITGMPIIEIIGQSEHFSIEQAFHETEYAQYLSGEEMAAALQSLKDGNSTVIRPIVDGKGLTVILLADPRDDRVRADYKTMTKLGLMETIDYATLIASQSPENEHIIQEILEIVGNIGFDGGNEKEIRTAVFYKDQEVLLQQVKQFGEDQVNYKVHLARLAEEDGYTIEGFDAILHKSIPLPATTKEGLPIGEMDNRFQEIPWATANFLDPKQRRLRLLDTIDTLTQQKVDQLLKDLEQYKHARIGGFTWEEILLYKHWRNTPQERFIPHLDQLNKVFRVECYFNQHSYLAVDAEEAYDLLNGKIAYRPELAMYAKGPAENHYLVMAMGKASNTLRWIKGDVVYQLEEQLWKLQLPKFQSVDAAKQLVHLLLAGEEVPISFSGEIEPKHFLVLTPIHQWVELQLNNLLLDQPWFIIHETHKGLFAQLENMGFEGYEQTLLSHLQQGHHQVSLEKFQTPGNDKVRHVAEIGISDVSTAYELKAVRTSLLQYIEVPDIKVGDMQTKTLEYQMNMEAWEKADYYQWGHDLHDVIPPGHFNSGINANCLLSELETLHNSQDPRAKWVAEAISTKYLLHTPNEGFLKDRSPIAYPYELTYRFEGEVLRDLTLENMYDLVDGRSVYAGVDPNGIEEWYKIDFSGLAVNRMPRLDKIPASDHWDPLARLFDIRLSDESYVELMDGLQNGDIVLLKAINGNNSYDIPVYADPENNRLVFSNYDQTSGFGKYLAGLPGWEYKRGPYREIGQQRDFEVHPVPVKQEILQEIGDRMKDLGFVKDYEEQAMLALQIGYPEFSINHEETSEDVKINAAVYFKADLRSNFCMTQGYVLSYVPDSEEEIKLSPGAYGTPRFLFQEAVNIAAGRYVHIPDEGEVDTWYSLNKGVISKEGFYGVKENIYPLAQVVAQIDKMPLKGLENEGVRRDLILSIIQGDLVPTAYTSGNREMPGYLFFDLEVGKVRFLFNMDAYKQYAYRGISGSARDNKGDDEHRQTNGRKPKLG